MHCPRGEGGEAVKTPVKWRPHPPDNEARLHMGEVNQRKTILEIRLGHACVAKLNVDPMLFMFSTGRDCGL